MSATIDRGSITVRRVKYNPMKFTGDTVADCRKLTACGCPMYFSECNFDIVLGKVSKEGFDLCELTQEGR